MKHLANSLIKYTHISKFKLKFDKEIKINTGSFCHNFASPITLELTGWCAIIVVK